MCPICKNVLYNAHLTGCCGKNCCSSCLTRWRQAQLGRNSCPACQKENYMHMSNKERICEVKQLKIHCTNHREGCGWVGELGGLKSHLDMGCGYVKITCTNEGCGERVSRKDLQTHLQEKCYYRPYKCEHCGHNDTYIAITGETAYLSIPQATCHYSECPEYPLPCPHRCGVTGIRRRAMPHHCSSCRLEPLDCPFKDAGCTEKIARKDMEDHMTANQQKHTLLTLQTLQQSNEQVIQDLNDNKRELQDIKQELQDTKQELQDTKQELQENKRELQDTKQELQDTKRELQDTKQELYDTKREIQDTKEDLQDTKQELQNTKQELQDTKGELQDTKRKLCTTEQELYTALQNVLELCKKMKQ